MLDTLIVKTFKSLENVTVDLGRVNVFIGANGSGKSNLLEALGVLSAAADGRVDDQTLLARGVRPGLPLLYKSAFPAKSRQRIHPPLYFAAHDEQARYEVSLHNPLKLKEPAPWRFKTERWEDDNGTKLVGRGPRGPKTNTERGLAALKAGDLTAGAALDLLTLLQGYVIFSPTTPVLRGVVPETQPRHPVGVSGGNLPRAILGLLRQRHHDKHSKHSKRICQDTLELVDWAASFGTTAAAASEVVLRFRDRFMRKDRNVLSGYDVSEALCMPCFWR